MAAPWTRGFLVTVGRGDVGFLLRRGASLLSTVARVSFGTHNLLWSSANELGEYDNGIR